jgi:hypothetical protein
MADGREFDEDRQKFEIEVPRYSMAPYQFLMSQQCCGHRKVMLLRCALGIDPFWLGTSTGMIASIVMVIAEALAFVPLVGHFLKIFVEQCFLNPIRMAAIVEFAESCSIPEDHFPVDIQQLDKVVTAYVKDCLVDKAIYCGPKMTDSEAKDVEDAVKGSKDILMPHNVLRYLGISNKRPFRVKTPVCYNCSYGCCHKCGFQHWYGGSRTAAKLVAGYLQEKDVPHSTVKPALDDWDAKWREYVRLFFARAAQDPAVATVHVQPMKSEDDGVTVNPVVAVAVMDRV